MRALAPPSSALFLALAVLVAGAGPASAYRMFLDTDYGGETLAVGDTLSVDLFLDTEGESDLFILSVAVLWDPTAVALRTDLSEVPSQILYTPAGGIGSPATSLESIHPLALWPGDRPPGMAQLNVDYVLDNFSAPSGTSATSDAELMASLTFEVLSGGETDISTAFTSANIVTLLREGSQLDITDQVSLDGSPVRINGGSVDDPVDPTEPVDPGDPTEPIDPMIPIDPIDPINPDGPSGTVPEPSAALLFATGCLLFGRASRLDRGRA
jgi:hypothetical protein